jgi:ribose transport system substrate-binding protein
LVSLVIGLAGCGGAEDGGGAGGETNERTYRIVMISAPPGDAFYDTIERSARRKAEQLGVDFGVQQIPRYTPEAQLPVLQAVLARSPDAIMIGPTDENALQVPLERAAERAKVVLFDTQTKDPSYAATFVSADIVKGGENVAKTLLDLTGGRGKFFYQGTLVDQTFFDSLYQGYLNVMRGRPGVELLKPQYSDTEPSKASQIMQAWLAGNDDLAGGFIDTIFDQEASVTAIERAGREGEIKTVGFDGAPENIKRLTDGRVNAIVSVAAADYGEAAIQAAVDAIDGKELPRFTEIRQCVLTRDNLDDPANRPCIYEDTKQ